MKTHIEYNRFYVIVFFIYLISSQHLLLAQVYQIKDKTKYYVASDNFGAATQYNLILDKKGYETVAKSLGVSKEDAKKIIEQCSANYQPKMKRGNDYGYIMYKICEVKIPLESDHFYGEVMYLMYFPNDINSHLPPDKLAANGKGFFQLEFPERVSTTPYKNETYKPQTNSKNDNYSFGFVFKSNTIDSIVVEKVINTSQAKTAGLQAGDIIVSVNDVNLRYYDRLKALELFKNCGFTNNKFKIIRKDKEVILNIDKVNTNVLQTVCITGNCDNGDCSFENINGYTIQGKCMNGILQGKVKFITKEGVVFYEGEIYKYPGIENNYRYKGYGIEKYTNGDKYEGQFQNGKKDGDGIYTKANGEIIKGFWREGKYYDEIAKGFDLEKIKTFNATRYYLYEQNLGFLKNANQVTFDDTSVTEFKKNNGLTDTEFDKLIKLCDFQYKPQNLNTPEKVKTLVNNNQEKYPYTIYSLGTLKALDGKYYMIIRMPEDENRWLPEAMHFTEYNSLFFIAPYSEIKSIDYVRYIDYKKQKEGDEFWKKVEEKNNAALSEYFNQHEKNQYLGIAIYQFSFWNYQKNDLDYNYIFVSVSGSPGQKLSNADYKAMDKLAGVEGKSKIKMEYKEGMDESKAEEYVFNLTRTHRFSITERYNYRIPQNSNTAAKYPASSYSKEEIEDIDKQLNDAYTSAKLLTNEMTEDKTVEKAELSKKISQNILLTNGDVVNEPAKVVITDVPITDKHYNDTKKFIGKTGNVEGTLLQDTDGTYYGMIKFEGEKSSTIFYKVKVKIIN